MFPLTGAEFGLSVDEPEEFLVDDSDEVPWLVELLNSACVSAPSVMRSSHWAGLSHRETQHNMRRSYDCHLIIECALFILSCHYGNETGERTLSFHFIKHFHEILCVCVFLLDVCAGFQEQS